MSSTMETIMILRIHELADNLLARLLTSTHAAASYTQAQYRCVVGTSGCAAYNHKYKQIRACIYNDNGSLAGCTPWEYYACGCKGLPGGD